ncbi:Tetratricopeptide repeat-domain-containing protein [Xylariaceae sp. FL0255]|nr:Tetratricopeptide repeat-domain-containing protein [Xylariaceae sp. FL0255]
MSSPSSGHTFFPQSFTVWAQPVHRGQAHPTENPSLSWKTDFATDGRELPPSFAVQADHKIATSSGMSQIAAQVPSYPPLQMKDHQTIAGTNDGSAILQQSMPPPTKSRKRKALTLRDHDWEPMKARIIELHINESLPLSEVQKSIKQEYAFEATPRQYRSAISRWGFDKNIKHDVMQAIVRKNQQRKVNETEKRGLNFKVHNIPVEPEKIDTWMKRNNIPVNAIYAPSPPAITPAALTAWTPSDHASPTPTIMSHIQSPTAMGMSRSSSLGHSNTIVSPTLSDCSTSQFESNTFTGQSPAPWPTDDQSSSTHRYRLADELRLQLQISHNTEEFGHKSLPTLEAELKLGWILFEQGRYKSAEDTFRRLEESCQTAYGKEHQLTLCTSSTLGVVFRNQGLLEKAKKVSRKCFEAQKALLGLDHPDTLDSMSNMSTLLFDQGRYSEAEEMHRQVLELRMKVLGAEHGSTLCSMHHIAESVAYQGHYSKAEEMHRQCLELSTKVLGAEHPDTLASMFCVADSLANQGRCSEALELHRQKLELSEKVLGAEHPDTITSMFAVAELLTHQGHKTESDMMHRQVLELRTRVLGAAHPDTLEIKRRVDEGLST